MALDTRSVNQFWQGVRSDTANFLSAFSQPEKPRIGLHTYDIAMANGRSMRIHLRFEPSGNGVLLLMLPMWCISTTPRR